MAWVEQMASGRWRGCWRDSSRKAQHIVQADGTGFERKTDAKEAAQEQEVKARRQAAAAAGTQSAKMPWGQLWELYNARPKRQRAASDTVSVQERNVKNYVMPKWGDTPINKISHLLVQDWIDEELDVPGRKSSYIQVIYSPFRASMNYAVKKLKILNASPCAGIELPKVPGNPAKVHTTVDEAERLDEHLHESYVRLRTFEHETGARPGECCGLHADQIDFDNRRVLISNVYVPGKDMIRAHPKDGDWRVAPLSAEAASAVRTALAGRDLTTGCGVRHADGSKCRSVLVFLPPIVETKVVKPKNYYMALWRASSKAEMPVRGPYTMRRGFATRAAENDVDPFTLQAILGHATLDETSGYVVLTEGALDQVIAKMGGPVGLKIVGRPEGRGADSGADVRGTPRDDTGHESGSDTG